MKPIGYHDRIIGAALLCATGIIIAEPKPDLPAPRLGSSEWIGVAAPSQLIVLSATLPGRIALLGATEGARVSAGDVLVALEDGIQRAKTEIARRDAESTLAIEFAKVRWDHSERALERLVGLHGNDYASNKELSDAWADREMRRVEHALAQWEHQQAVGSFERERETLRAFQILAPFDGVVSAHHRHVGETVDVGEPILTLARLDPLEVVLDVPLALSREIREGGEVAVQPLGAMGPALTGVVTCKSRVADAASQTLKTKITVPDRDGQWIAGTKVIVDFRFPGVPATVAPSAGGFVRPGSE